MPVAPTLKLNDGNEIPAFGLGTTFPPGFDYDTLIDDALKIGYRLFDTAMAYKNQEVLGEALRKGCEKHGLKREEIFVTSKVDSTHHSKENVIKNCELTLQQLKFDYVDLLLIHSPWGLKEGSDEHWPKDENGKFIYSNIDYLETWEGMIECQKRGIAKSIGVSNFHIKQLERIMANSNVKPTVNQVEAHPYYSKEELLQFCKKHDIIIEAYGALSAPYDMKSFGGLPAKEMQTTALQDPASAEIGKKYNKSPAQVLLRWAIQRGTVPLPRSTNKERLAQNFYVFDFNLTEDEMKQIDGMNRNMTAYPFLEVFKDHPYYDK